MGVVVILLLCKEIEDPLNGDKGIQVKAIVVNKVERGVKGEKGIQGDNSDVLSVLADHLPIQLATRYGEIGRVS